MGIGFALDEFGTGYSSLTYLRRLPASVLKIDQSFVRDMLDDPDDMAILEGVLGLARAFRTQVIAEGVETPAHGQMLLRLGCEWGQGLAIAPPMPAGDLPAWLTGWQPEASWLNVSTAAHEDLPLLTAMVEHRAWVADLTSYVQGQRSTPPPLDVHSCRFGRWLHHQSNRHRLHKPDQFASIDRLHNDIHQQATQLVGWTQTGQTEHIAASLPALRTTRDALLDHMMQLLD
jgi:hypothetical protein